MSVEPTYLGSTDPVHDVNGTHMDVIYSINSEEDLPQHNIKKQLTREMKALGQIDELRPTHSSRRKPISYAGMLGEVTNEIIIQDNSCLSTFDHKVSKPLQSSSTRLHTATSYLTSDNTYEDIHPCAHTANLQASSKNNSTYGEVLQTPDHEQDEWHKVMVKELSLWATSARSN